MKKFFFLVIFVIFLLSCSNHENSGYSSSAENNLKQKMTDMESQISWTAELEGKLLSENIKTNPLVAHSQTLNGNVLKILSDSDKIYPFIPDFGSLDNSFISTDLKKTISLFVALYSENPEECVTCFEKDSLYSYILFHSDFSKILIKSGEIESYKIGRELNSTDEEISFPVRFFCKNGTIDVIIKANLGSSLITQIEIEKWA